MLQLSKGQGVGLSLAKVLTELKVGLSWDVRRGDGPAYDLDVLAIPVDANNRAIEEGIVFYNQLSTFGGAILHSGDNKTGDAAGDDEVISFKLGNLPSNVQRIKLIINIHSPADGTFGRVSNSKVTFYGAADDGQDLRFDLEEDNGRFRTVTAAELYRYQNGWRVKGLEEGYSGGLAKLLNDYGVQTAG